MCGEAGRLMGGVPAVEADLLRALEQVGGVPVTLPTPAEEPPPVAPPVFVVVSDRHHDPAITHLVLGPAVHLPGGRLRLLSSAGLTERDAVPADLVDRSVELAHRGGDPFPQGLTPTTVPPHVHVGHEQLDPRI